MHIVRCGDPIFGKKRKKSFSKWLAILLFQVLVFLPGMRISRSQSLEPPNRKLPLTDRISFQGFPTAYSMYNVKLAFQGEEKPMWRISPVAYMHRNYKNRTSRRKVAFKVKPFSYGRLESDIWKELAVLKKKRLLVPGDEVSIRVLDLTAGRLLASINADKRRMSASLIKPFVMLAVYDRVYHGDLKRDKRLERLLRRMIVVSNNWATNRLVKILGKGNPEKGLAVVNRVIGKYRFYHTKMVEIIPRGGKTYRNYTTARDLSRFFYLLYHKRLVSQHFSELMMRKLLKVRTSRIRTYVLRRDGVPVADKTGFVCGLNGDAGIVFQSKAISGGRDYIFVLMVENKGRPPARRWRCHKTRVLRRLSNKIYLAFRVHALKGSKIRVAALRDTAL